mgnify:CR=1 FL=1
MIYTQHYESPLGGILLAADDIGLTGLWFEGQKYFARTLDTVHQEQETAVLSEARRWLDVYFGGQEPDFTPLALPFSRRCGRCCAVSPAARPRPMVHWQGSLPQSAAFPGCLRRLWAGLSDTM